MSYSGSGMGIAIPAYRGQIWRREGVTAGHQMYSESGRLPALYGFGGSAPVPTSQGSATYSPLDAAARQAIAAINAATSDQIRGGLAAVRSFQSLYGQGLTVDGILGTHTRAALLAVVPGASLPGSSAAAATTTRTYVSQQTGAPITEITGPDLPIDPSADPARPVWAIPLLAIGGVVLLSSGLLLMQRGTRLRSNRLRRNRKR